MSETATNELWNQIETFAGYGFNKAHAASYALVAYQTAYLKSNFPPEYMSALMTSNKDDLDKLAMEIDECKRMGIAVLPPSINESFVDFGVVKETGNVRFGLSAIKHVGAAVAEEIVEDRKNNGKFKDVAEVLTRLGPKVINKKSLEALAMAGALDDLAERNELIFNMERMLAFAAGSKKNRDSKQTSLFGEDVIETAKIEFEATQPADKKQRLAWERELLGMYVSEHPLSEVAPLIEPYQQKKVIEISPEMENRFVRIAGIITTVQEIITKKNSQKMAFIKVEDQTKNIEVLVFPKIFAATPTIFTPDKIIVVDGYVSNKDGELKILAEEIFPVGLPSGDPLGDVKIPEFVARDKKKLNNWGGNGNVNGGGYDPPAVETRESSAPVDIKPETLRITIPPGSGPNILKDIKNIIAIHPGKSPVIMRVPKNGSGWEEIKIKNRLDASPVVKRKLKEIVGDENIN
jgi:DNA polymerase-3 subunit alpha